MARTPGGFVRVDIALHSAAHASAMQTLGVNLNDADASIEATAAMLTVWLHQLRQRGLSDYQIAATWDWITSNVRNSVLPPEGPIVDGSHRNKPKG